MNSNSPAMGFNYLTQPIAIGYDNLFLTLLDDIYPVIIDAKEEAVYTVGKGTMKGIRILGKEYWNTYSLDALLAHVISSSQLGNNYKWFLSQIVENVAVLKSRVK